MIARFRVIGLTMLALAVPAFAFGGEEAPSGPAALSVSAQLGGCGLAEAAIVCQIEASWSAVEGAEHYTVSVTRADGSVVDLGESAGTARSIFVPYVGPGTYSVQVAAWGTPPGEEEPEVLARDTAASSETAARSTDRVASQPGGPGPAGDGRSTGTPVEGVSVGEDRVTEPPPADPPECPEPPETDPQPEPQNPPTGEEPGLDADTTQDEEPPVTDDPDDPDVCP